MRRVTAVCETTLPILAEASNIINGDRNEDYGDHEREAERIAQFWTSWYGDRMPGGVTPDDVDACMILLKLARERYKHKRDNLVDICGYTALWQERYDFGGYRAE